MAEQIDPKQQHLDDHYGDLGLRIVDEPTGGTGKGLSPAEARSFLRGLRPVARVAQTLKDAAKKVKPKG
jgi:hypothetical protein